MCITTSTSLHLQTRHAMIWNINPEVETANLIKLKHRSALQQYKNMTYSTCNKIISCTITSYHHQLKQEAQLLLVDRATWKPTKDCWNGRGNDNLGWNDLQMYFKVIKSGTNRKLRFGGSLADIVHSTNLLTYLLTARLLYQINK